MSWPRLSTLVAAIPIPLPPCPDDGDRRVKPGDDHNERTNSIGSRSAQTNLADSLRDVMAALVAAIPIPLPPCPDDRGRRVKPGDDRDERTNSIGSRTAQTNLADSL